MIKKLIDILKPKTHLKMGGLKTYLNIYHITKLIILFFKK